MSTKNKDMQNIIRLYREETGESGINMEKVVDYAVKRLGYPLPKPKSPFAILAEQFSYAAREEVKNDKTTGRPYRVNHAVPSNQGTLWWDIDTAPRGPMLKALILRREGMVADGVMLSYDVDHWNAINPNEQPIQMEFDLGPDIEWRKKGTDDKTAA